MLTESLHPSIAEAVVFEHYLVKMMTPVIFVAHVLKGNLVEFIKLVSGLLQKVPVSSYWP